MIELGKIQNLIIKRSVDFGVYLISPEGRDEVLLPKKYVPDDARLGDEISVFVYTDSEDRPVATTVRPVICTGEIAVLEIVDVTRIGAFASIGLDKDILLPYKEQTAPVKAGDRVLCAMYVDKTGRLALTMNVYKFLEIKSPYNVNDMVRGICYEDSDNFGMFVAVDNKYSGLISKKEMTRDIKIGDELSLRVAGKRSDGRLVLSLRKSSLDQIDDDIVILKEIMKKNGGALPLGEDASAAEIKSLYKMSKKQLKRAIGRMLSEGTINKVADKLVLQGSSID